ncbi:uncharacterized protein [Solanum lycopersicum]|uniref:uncharacterized protein n=1 Tax=Solanum lycopersicum TaxID=4081 RepID=UPI000532A938|nr:uncharacterized protein LOC104649371 [Solanum lycopersicum]
MEETRRSRTRRYKDKIVRISLKARRLAILLVGIMKKNVTLISDVGGDLMQNAASAINRVMKLEKKKVRIGNGECLAVKGNGVIAITSGSRTKLITYVLYVPDLDRNLLSVDQLMENGFNLSFKDKTCVMEDPSGNEIFKVKWSGGVSRLILSKKSRQIFS